MGALVSKCHDIEVAKAKQPPTCDVYRNSPLRLLGYATHVGVCSGLLSTKALLTGQMLTTAYICGDIFQKAAYSRKQGGSDTQIGRDAVDALIWQLLASILIPGFILNRTKFYTREVLRKTAKTACGPAPQHMKILPCVISLILMPLIMKPIDNCVDDIMNKTYREWAKEDANPVKKAQKN